MDTGLAIDGHDRSVSGIQCSLKVTAGLRIKRFTSCSAGIRWGGIRVDRNKSVTGSYCNTPIS